MGAAPALVLHPMLAQARVMGSLLGALSPEVAARAIDLPGHGAAPDWQGARDYADMACELALGAMEQPMHLIGHSYGAYVALRLAVERPNLVQSLSLYEPVFFAAAEHADPVLAELYAKEASTFMSPLKAGKSEDAARAFFDYWGGGTPWGFLRPEQRSYITDRIHLVGASEPSLVADTGGVWDRLAQVQGPCLLMSGQRSPAIAAAVLDALQMNIPQARRVLIEDGSHMAPVNQASQVAAAIKDFLNL